MKSTNYIEFNITPVPKPRMVRSDRWRNRSCVLRYWEFKDRLVELANDAGYVPGDTLDVIFYLPMPKSWSKKKREKMNATRHQQKPDTDNLMKAFKDCLIKKDESVFDERSRKFWANKGKIVVIK